MNVEQAESATPAESLPAEPAASPDASSGSSPAESQGEQSQTLLDVVSQAVEPGESPTPEPESVAADGAKELSQEEKDLAQEEADKQLPFHKHQRFQELVSQKNEYKAKSEKLESEIEGYRQRAEGFDRIVSRAEESGVDPQGMEVMMNLAGLYNSDPVQFLNHIAPLVQHAMEQTGDFLPRNIAEQVERGDMSAEAARRVAVQQAENARLQERQKLQESQAQAQHFKALMDSNATAVNALEEQWQKTDPDYPQKASLVHQLYRLSVDNLMRSGKVLGPKESVDLLNQVKANVEENLRKALGSSLPKKVVSIPNTSGPKGKPQAVPNSLRDVVDNALASGS